MVTTGSELQPDRNRTSFSSDPLTDITDSPDYLDSRGNPG